MTGHDQPLWRSSWQGLQLSVFGVGSEAAGSAAAAEPWLSPVELERARRFHFPADREVWMACRRLARSVIAAHLHVPPAAIEFSAGPCGKPALPAFPGCGFNWSHSASRFALALGTAECGIDIEWMKPGLPFESLAAHVFQPQELALLTASAEPQRLFYALWTAKEAVMKCDGRGMTLPPVEIRVELHGDTPAAAFVPGCARYALYSAVLDDFALCAAVRTGD